MSQTTICVALALMELTFTATWSQRLQRLKAIQDTTSCAADLYIKHHLSLWHAHLLHTCHTMGKLQTKE